MSTSFRASALTLLFLLGAVWPLSAPAAEPAEADANVKKLAESRQKWTDFVEKSGGTYAYEVSNSSFTGARWTTTITVRDGKVVERSYAVYGPPQPMVGFPAPKPMRSWTEVGEKIGSHAEGAPPRTVEAMYDAAKALLAEDLEDSERLYLRFNDQGILSSCFVVDTRIADDAPRRGVPPFQIKAPE